MKKEKASPVKKTKAEDKLENIVPEAAVAAEKTAAAPSATVNKVGALLKDMRLRKNLKLTDISKKLCIRKFYLEAIEESRYQDIPEFPYGIGFIRSYADFLGLNSSNIIELYKEETESKPDKDIFVLEPQAEATVPSKKYLLVSLLALVLIYVLWSVYNSRVTAFTEEMPEEILPAAAVGDSSAAQPLVVEDYSVETDAVEAKSQAEPLAFVDTTVANQESANVVITDQAFTGEVDTSVSAPAPYPAAEVLPAEAAAVPAAVETIASKGVVVKITGETWVEVKDTDHLYLSKVLKEGDTYTVPENGRGMILSVGRPSAAEVYIDGKLTTVATPAKKTNIALDKFLNANH